MNLEKVNRIEVIDENGRSYVNWKKNNKVFIEIQDDNKTLKVFISKQKNTHDKNIKPRQ